MERTGVSIKKESGIDMTIEERIEKLEMEIQVMRLMLDNMRSGFKTKVLQIVDDQGNVRIGLGVINKHNIDMPGMWLYNKNGKIHAMLTVVWGHPSLTLHDENEKPRALPIAETLSERLLYMPNDRAQDAVMCFAEWYCRMLLFSGCTEVAQKQ